MFELRKSDTLVELRDLPQSSIGAPCPMVVATEHDLHVTFYLNEVTDGWDGKTVRVVGPNSGGEPSVIVTFHQVLAHYFGPPNDEAITGHPLSAQGLRPYSYYEVRNSSWLDELEKKNRVHPSHRKDSFSEFRHFIFTFHDTTLEVLARSYGSEVTNLPLVENVVRVLKKIH